MSKPPMDLPVSTTESDRSVHGPLPALLLCTLRADMHKGAVPEPWLKAACVAAVSSPPPLLPCNVGVSLLARALSATSAWLAGNWASAVTNAPSAAANYCALRCSNALHIT